ncbi:MAG TPA: hypothetical protein VHM70_29570 [Polyangiaceae bacterium]|jgi:hypothetical protein|nr:hypothetical protein [Polyangiaceae bacterium]
MLQRVLDMKPQVHSVWPLRVLAWTGVAGALLLCCTGVVLQAIFRAGVWMGGACVAAMIAVLIWGEPTPRER